MTTELDQALARARGRGARVALKMSARWCSLCDVLSRDVLDRPEGKALFEGAERLDLDFDAPGSDAIVERLAILELPTIVVLDGEGRELGRVVGYEDPASFVRAAREALTASDPMPALEEAWAREPSDPIACLALGEALLSRDPERGLALLERVSLRPDDHAARALWMLGRYTQRVRGDVSSARWIWQSLGERFPASRHAEDAWWWYALAQSELGRLELGSAALEERVRREPTNVDAILEWNRFAARNGYEPARAAIRDAAMAALRTARGDDRDQLEEAVLWLGRPFDSGKSGV